MRRKKGALKGARKSLMKGRVRHLGPAERLKLKLAGRIDGKRGLPRRMEEDGAWTSPHLQSEVHAYEEVCTQTWGGLQLFEEETYALLRQLEEKLAHVGVELADLGLEPEAGKDKPVRKEGEEELSDAQVATRREAERRRRMAPVRARATALETAQKALREEKTRLESRLVEERHCVQLVSRRLAEHMAQRVSAYWNAALVCHPEREAMPPVISVTMTSHAEELYVRQHREILASADEKKEVA